MSPDRFISCSRLPLLSFIGVLYSSFFVFLTLFAHVSLVLTLRLFHSSALRYRYLLMRFVIKFVSCPVLTGTHSIVSVLVLWIILYCSFGSACEPTRCGIAIWISRVLNTSSRRRLHTTYCQVSRHQPLISRCRTSIVHN